ncbi:MAG: hypothetical protein R3D33_13500 [Hyphomicrobiaceae bacterium]
MSSWGFASARTRAQHAKIYGGTLIWLVRRGMRYCRKAFVLAPMLVVLSVAAQIASFRMIADAVHRIADPQSRTMLDRIWAYLAPGDGRTPDLVLISAIGGLMLAATTARYFAGVLALASHGRTVSRLTEDAMQSLLGVREIIRHWTINRRFDEAAIMQTISIDFMRCGFAMRMIVRNIINMIYLVAGILIIAALSLKLLALIVLAGIIGILVLYPLNLRSMRYNNAFDVEIKERRRVIRSMLDRRMAPVAKGDAEANSGRGRDAEAFARFEKVLFLSKWPIEAADYLLNLMFMLLVVGFLVISGTDNHHLLTAQSLLLLFLAVRYTYLGQQGILVTLTSINRFFSSIIRTKSFLSFLEDQDLAGADGRSSPVALGRPPAYPWKVSDPRSPRAEGTLAAGEVYLVAEPVRNVPTLLFRLLSFVVARRHEFAGNYLAGEAGPVEADIGGAPDGAPVRWIEDAIAASRSGQKSQWRQLLIELDRQAETSGNVVVTQQAALLNLPADLMAALRQRLGAKILIMTAPWSGPLRQSRNFDWLLVCNGETVAFAGRREDLDDAQWANAQALYAAEPEPPADLDEDDSQLI